MLLPTEPLGDPNRMKGEGEIFLGSFFLTTLVFDATKKNYIKCCNVLPDFGPLWWGGGVIFFYFTFICLLYFSECSGIKYEF